MGIGENAGCNVGENTGASGIRRFETITPEYTYIHDSEDGVVGQLANTDPSGTPHLCLSKTTFSDENPNTGNQSIKCVLDAYSTGGAEWGLYYNWGNLYQGDEIWFRGYWNMDGFDYSGIGGATNPKGLRLFTKSGSGVIRYINVYPNAYQIHVANWAAGIVYGDVFYPNNGGYNSDPEIQTCNDCYSTPALSGWESIEVYVKISSVAGQAILRAWRNDVLFFEDELSPTLLDSSGTLYGASWFTYVGNQVDTQQTTWIDDVVIQINGDPGKTDAQGNKFIGK